MGEPFDVGRSVSKGRVDEGLERMQRASRKYGAGALVEGAMEDWQEEYKRKMISAEEAAKLVKSGDRVHFTMGREALAVGLQIAARKEELRDVQVVVPAPGYDFGWYDAGWEESFKLYVGMITATCQEAVDAKRVEILVAAFVPGRAEAAEAMESAADVLITEVSPPDDKGFCSFGASLWGKKRQIKAAKLTIAEVNPRLIRTYGDNFVHVSDIDYFVEHQSSGGLPGMGSLAGRELKQPEPYLKDIAGYVSELINDGDTLQIGVGRTTEPLVQLGLLDNKHDIGYHSEATPPGIVSLVRERVITGKYKTLNPGKVVVTSVGGSSREEMEWVNNNPAFHLIDVAELEDVTVIGAHDNFVALNNALMVDLWGQIASETVGGRLLAQAGGQIPFAIGSLMSRNGRFIIALPSTAQGGTVSRIVPYLPLGTIVTIQRHLAHYIVTEYGIAHLLGKTMRQRAEELISVAHPDFRAELRKEAQRLFWP